MAKQRNVKDLHKFVLYGVKKNNIPLLKFFDTGEEAIKFKKKHDISSKDFPTIKITIKGIISD